MEIKHALNEAVTERELSECVRTLAKMKGYLAYHTHNSRYSEAGFPDWVFVGGCRIIFAELKREKANPTEAQERWIEELGLASCWSDGRVEVHVWRPSDWNSGRIAEVLY